MWNASHIIVRPKQHQLTEGIASPESGEKTEAARGNRIFLRTPPERIETPSFTQNLLVSDIFPKAQTSYPHSSRTNAHNFRLFFIKEGKKCMAMSMEINPSGQLSFFLLNLRGSFSAIKALSSTSFRLWNWSDLNSIQLQTLLGE